MKKELIDARELAMRNADALVKKSEDSGEALTNEEMETLRGYHTEIEDLDKKIEVLDKQEKLRAATAKPAGTPVANIPAVHNVEPVSTEHVAVSKRYSLIKALRSVVNPDLPLEGVEKEMNQEAIEEMRSAGLSKFASGVGLHIPNFLSGANPEKRANEQVVDPDPQGGYTVENRLREVLPVLRPDVAMMRAGSTFLGGLRENIDFTDQLTGAGSNWATEIAALDQASQTYGLRTMVPHRLGCWTPISLQLLIQSSIDMEQFVRNDISASISQEVEIAFYNGSGTNPVPFGILNTPGINTVVAGDPNGGPLTFDILVDMETGAELSNAPTGMGGYITNSSVKGQLKKERTDPGSGLFTWAQDGQFLNGYPAYISNNMPGNLSKGTNTNNLSAAIFSSDWAQALVGQWGGTQILLDQYTKAIEGQVVLSTNTFWDFLLRYPEAFSACVDIDTGKAPV